MGSIIELLRKGYYKEDSTSGTTTDTDTAIVTEDMRGKSSIIIHLKNCGTTNDLTYTFVVYAKYSGSIPYTEKTGTLSPNDVAQLSVEQRRPSKVVLYVKSTTTGSSTDYIAEWNVTT